MTTWQEKLKSVLLSYGADEVVIEGLITDIESEMSRLVAEATTKMLSDEGDDHV